MVAYSSMTVSGLHLLGCYISCSSKFIAFHGRSAARPFMEMEPAGMVGMWRTSAVEPGSTGLTGWPRVGPCFTLFHHRHHVGHHAAPCFLWGLRPTGI
jgi:hypothetical protein